MQTVFSLSGWVVLHTTDAHGSKMIKMMLKLGVLLRLMMMVNMSMVSGESVSQIVSQTNV